MSDSQKVASAGLKVGDKTAPSLVGGYLSKDSICNQATCNCPLRLADIDLFTHILHHFACKIHDPKESTIQCRLKEYDCTVSAFMRLNGEVLQKA